MPLVEWSDTVASTLAGFDVECPAASGIREQNTCRARQPLFINTIDVAVIVIMAV
jgi:hypothetical protein